MYIMSYTTSKTLLEKIKTGDEDAWNDFYNRYYWLIYSVGRKADLDKHFCCDLVQQVMCTVFAQGDKFRYQSELGKFRCYLLGITKNVIRKIKRSNREVELTLEMQADDEAADAEIEKIFTAEWHHYMLYVLLQELRTKVEEITFDSFQMYILQQMSPSDVAAALGISVNAVYVHKNRCLTYLKTIVAEISQSDPTFKL